MELRTKFRSRATPRPRRSAALLEKQGISSVADASACSGFSRGQDA